MRLHQPRASSRQLAIIAGAFIGFAVFDLLLVGSAVWAGLDLVMCLLVGLMWLAARKDG
jgi:predicted small integral membrane protein